MNKHIFVRTYSETRQCESFDWHSVLDYLIGTHDGEAVRVAQEYELSSKSANWITCACGNQCAVIPRHGDGTPVDETLLALGLDFTEAVQSYNYKTAQRILGIIERRSAELTQRATNSNKKEAARLLALAGYELQIED
jgi:hypothetical protein